MRCIRAWLGTPSGGAGFNITVDKMGLERMVSKRRGSLYPSALSDYLGEDKMVGGFGARLPNGPAAGLDAWPWAFVSKVSRRVGWRRLKQ